MNRPPSHGDEHLPRASDAHGDQVWEVELAEQMHERHARAHAELHSGLRRHLDWLHERYGEHATPADLAQEALPEHAANIEHHYRRIAAHVAHVLSPTVREMPRLRRHLRNNLEIEVYYQSAHQAREELLSQMKESARYWRWVRKHHRLPLSIAWWLGSFCKRPIVHPWTAVDGRELATLAQLEQELEL
ncbi:MAG: hypothetical protein ACODAQ_09530 [Phycisphaeraceae bacterium]